MASAPRSLRTLRTERAPSVRCTPSSPSRSTSSRWLLDHQATSRAWATSRRRRRRGPGGPRRRWPVPAARRRSRRASSTAARRSGNTSRSSSGGVIRVDLRAVGFGHGGVRLRRIRPVLAQSAGLGHWGGGLREALAGVGQARIRPAMHRGRNDPARLHPGAPADGREHRRRRARDAELRAGADAGGRRRATAGPTPRRWRWPAGAGRLLDCAGPVPRRAGGDCRLRLCLCHHRAGPRVDQADR